MDKYKTFKVEARKMRSKKKMCLDKKQYETKQEAFQQGQNCYKCKHCGKWHRSGKIAKFITQLVNGKFKTEAYE